MAVSFYLACAGTGLRLHRAAHLTRLCPASACLAYYAASLHPPPVPWPGWPLTTTTTAPRLPTTYQTHCLPSTCSLYIYAFAASSTICLRRRHFLYVAFSRLIVRPLHCCYGGQLGSVRYAWGGNDSRVAAPYGIGGTGGRRCCAHFGTCCLRPTALASAFSSFPLRPTCTPHTRNKHSAGAHISWLHQRHPHPCLSLFTSRHLHNLPDAIRCRCALLRRAARATCRTGACLPAVAHTHFRACCAASSVSEETIRYHYLFLEGWHGRWVRHRQGGKAQ